MKISEFKRQLQALGARFEEGTKHTKVYLNGKQTTLPRHATQEMGEPLRRAILRQLGVKQKGR
jgi:mRNA interferase HicA